MRIWEVIDQQYGNSQVIYIPVPTNKLKIINTNNSQTRKIKFLFDIPKIDTNFIV